MTDLPDDPPRTAYDVLADVVDLCNVIDTQRPGYRQLTQRIRDLITTGLVETA